MVTVKTADKRHKSGYRIVFFKSDTITEEIVQFVQGNPKAFCINSFNEYYGRRDEFLKAYMYN